MLRGRRALSGLSVVAVAAMVLAGGLAVAAMDLGYSRTVTPGLVARYKDVFGAAAPTRLSDWQQFARATAGQFSSVRNAMMDRILLDAVNTYFNRIPGVTDQDHWHADDYWATPAEMLASNGGDCEDYAIAKYQMLRELGVPIVRLRMVYVRAGQADEAHMVLAYYPESGTEPLILDNLDRDIRPAAQRADLRPVYSFNDDDLEVVRANAPALRASPANNRKWVGLLDKLQQELTY